jgi:hypothetical protein
MMPHGNHEIQSLIHIGIIAVANIFPYGMYLRAVLANKNRQLLQIWRPVGNIPCIIPCISTWLVTG